MKAETVGMVMICSMAAALVVTGIVIFAMDDIRVGIILVALLGYLGIAAYLITKEEL